jgi:hypothetical protein
MTKLALLAAIVLALAAAPRADAVTYQASPPTNVTIKAGYATGNMAAVRNGAWPKESVWCGQDAYKGGAQTFECGMTDATGVTVSCNVFEPNMIATLRSIKSDSQLTITWDVGGIECTSMSVTDASAFAPKKQA